MTASINSYGSLLGVGIQNAFAASGADPRGMANSASNYNIAAGQRGANTLSPSTMLGNAPIETSSAITEKDLKHAAMETPIYTLLNLWGARYGNDWVDMVEIENDPFFAIAHKRLKQMGQLEQHYLTDRARFVCRKPE